MIAKTLWKQIHYTPHPRQLEFHASDARFKVAICGRRFGKSRMAAAEIEPMLLNPDKLCRGWIVAPQYDTGEKEFRYVWDDVMIQLKLQPLIAAQGRSAYNLRTGEMYIQMPWGSRLDVKSADRPDSLIGEGLDFVIMSEAAKQREETWFKYIRPALADRRGSAIFPSTPEGYNWLYKLHQWGQDRDNNPDWESWNFPSWENPYVYPGGWNDPEVQAQLKTPDDPEFWQELGADFRSVVGLVYGEFNEKVHVINNYTYNPEWENYIAVDFGFTNQTAVYDIQVSPEEDTYIWREYYHRFKTSDQAATECFERENPEGYSVKEIHGDAAAAEGRANFRKVYQVPVIGLDAAKDKLVGIAAIKRRLLARKLHIVRGACPEIIKEFNEYKTPKGNRNKLNMPEEPEKKNDHGLDAIRYFEVGHFVLGASMHMDPMLVSTGPDEEFGGEGIFRYDVDSPFALTGSIFDE